MLQSVLSEIVFSDNIDYALHSGRMTANLLL